MTDEDLMGLLHWLVIRKISSASCAEYSLCNAPDCKIKYAHCGVCAVAQERHR